MGCARLEAVTYTDPRVIDYLNSQFICVRVNLMESPQLARQFAVAWTPVVFALHPRNIRLRESLGYLPPDEMLAELKIMRALYELRSGRPERCGELLETVCQEHSGSKAVPEALYWKGIAAYMRTGHDKESLFAIWRGLLKTYPDSVWALKTTLTDWPDSPYLGGE